MAVVQISRIQHRRGTYSDLPQLAAGELGWAIDEQRLFIGNGPVSEGAPAVGNTEILTSGANLFELLTDYTYRGNTATPVTTGAGGAKIKRTFQQKFDDWASVKDFGAVGNGTTDDTAAIQRAIQNLVTSDATADARRTLYFPAGTYKVTGAEIKIYPFTTILGDGADQTIIKQTDASQDYVARTVDSGGNTGANIGSGSNTVPQHIDITGVSFESSGSNSGLLLDRAKHVRITDCQFKSTWAQGDAVGSGYRGVDAESGGIHVTKHVTFDHCTFTGIQYAFSTDYDVESVNFQNCYFDILYKGIKLGQSTDGSTAGQANGPRFVRVIGSQFDNIDLQAVHIYDNGSPKGNTFAFNSFKDIGTANDGTSDVAVLNIAHPDNFVINNHFTRTDQGTQSAIQGTAIHQKALSKATLNDNTSTFTTTGIDVDFANEYGVNIKYLIIRGSARRNGTLSVAGTSTGTDFVDNFVENSACGVTLFVTTGGVVQYKTTSTGDAATFKYSIESIV